jgi:hypothetical protein
MNNSMNHTMNNNDNNDNNALIHSDFQIKEVEAVVRRDAFTTIHVHVPPYETNILRNLFGSENVTVIEHASKTTISPKQEYDRLCARYGHEVVAKVFGEDDGDRLMEIVRGLLVESEEAVKVVKPDKKAKPIELENTQVQKINQR